MRLPDAMRLGATLKPQAISVFYNYSTGGTCVMGGALDAVGRLVQDDPMQCHLNIEELWMWCRVKSETLCPECGTHECSVYETAVHLNNVHEWTRDAIADWIEKYDPTPIPLKEPEEEEVAV